MACLIILHPLEGNKTTIGTVVIIIGNMNVIIEAAEEDVVVVSMVVEIATTKVSSIAPLGNSAHLHLVYHLLIVLVLP